MLVPAMHAFHITCPMCGDMRPVKDRKVLLLDADAILKEARGRDDAIDDRAGIVLSDRFPAVKI